MKCKGFLWDEFDLISVINVTYSGKFPFLTLCVLEVSNYYICPKSQTLIRPKLSQVYVYDLTEKSC